MSSKIEAGLEHIQKLDIRVARSPEDIIKKISKTMNISKQAAETTYFNLYEKNTDGTDSINYNKKNSNYNIAMAVSGSYDADIVRKACNWITEHKEYFGKEILEIGCDCGFMTTFLASTFPDSYITSIDKNQSGIDIAKKNVELLNLSNVSFECIDAKDLNKKFDTVFSMRTMHENIEKQEDIVSIDDFQEQGKIYKKHVENYANTISNLLSANGQFISIERSERSPLFLGWLEALSEHNLYLKLTSYEELKCLEVGDINEFQALVINNDEENRNEPYESFLWCATKYMDTSLGQYKNWEALCMFEIQRGKKIKEDIYLSPEDIPVMRLACWTHRSDKTGVLYFQDNGQTPVLSFYDISQKDNIIVKMKEEKKRFTAAGYKIKQI